jgi:5-methylcytosine-specific restriction enzyme A
MRWKSSAPPLPRNWESLRRQALQRDGWLCVECEKAGRVVLAKDVDHVVSRARGGSNALTNLQSLCRRCHLRKSALDLGRKPREPRPAFGLDGYPIEEP